MANGFCNTIADYPTADGAMAMLFSLRDCVPALFQSLLFVIFLVLFGSNYYLIKSKTGRAKILVALLSSSFVMTVLSMLLALAQLITYVGTVFYGFLCIVVYILFLISDDN